MDTSRGIMVCFHCPTPIPIPIIVPIQIVCRSAPVGPILMRKLQWKLVKLHLISTDAGAKMGTVPIGIGIGACIGIGVGSVETVQGCARFAEILSELTKTWSSGATECGVWIGNCNVKVWKSTEHKLHNIWRSLKFQQNEHTPAHYYWSQFHWNRYRIRTASRELHRLLDAVLLPWMQNKDSKRECLPIEVEQFI